MKTIVLIFSLLILSVLGNAQIRVNNLDAKAGMVVLTSTFVAVESMKIPADYYFTPMYNVRARQKATVAATGMITTVATVFIIQLIQKRHHHRR